MDYKEDINLAIKILREGGIILYPTDTIWGLGCDATNNEAVEKIFRIKSRHDSKSLIVLVNSETMLERYVKAVPAIAFDLVEISDKPLTIIYPGGKNLAASVLAKDGSVGIRICRDEFCNTLIEHFRKPIVSTSANISGGVSPSIYDEISEDVLKSVDYAVKHGRENLQKRSPSSILKVELNGAIKIIRK
jgi:L-threonylcarbamoyladenylate synthase